MDIYGPSLRNINIHIIIYSGLIHKVLSITYSRLLKGTYVDYNTVEFFRGIAFCGNICKWVLFMVHNIYNRPNGILIGWFLGAIKYIKERLANMVVILKAWLFVKGLKVVRNISKVSYS